MTFEEWKAAIDVILLAKLGCTQDDLPDWLARDAFDDEVTPEEAAEYTQTFEGAAQSACWFWETNKLNQYADTGDILTMTKRINGGTIGLEDRKKHYAHALHVLGVH